jgi:hypothetical protein
MQPICTHKISVQSSKPSHACPIIRLPREFRRLAGAAATIYKTTHNGALAFLVVPYENNKLVVPKGLNGHKLDTDVYERSLDMAEVAGPNPAEPIILFVIRFARTVYFVFLRYEEYGDKERHLSEQVKGPRVFVGE